MKIVQWSILLVFFSFISFSFAQKKEINASVYAQWKKNENQQISPNGRYISYEINPLFGDGFVYLYDTETAVLDSFPRGKQAGFSFQSDYFVYKIVPGYDTLRTCELKKIDKKKWPKDSLGIIVLSTKNLRKLSDIKSFELGKEHNFLSYYKNSDELTKVTPTKKKWWKKSKKPVKAIQSDGTALTILDPIANFSKAWLHVTNSEFSKNGKYATITTHQKSKKDSYQLDVFDLALQKTHEITQQQTSIPSVVFSENQRHLAFLSSQDTSALKKYDLT